ncbi:MAG: winged helix-turn-helix domain-containing protein [Blastocatellia bacterium]
MTMQGKCLYEFGEFTIDPEERLLKRQGKVVSISPKVFDLLYLFVTHQGALLDKETLMAALWADSFVEESNLSYTLSMLRKALGERDGVQKYIQTFPKRGYRFVVAVKTVTAPVPPSRPETIPTSPATKATALLPKRFLRLRESPYGISIFLVTLLVAVIAALGFWYSRTRPNSPSPAPFRNMQIRRLTSTGTAYEAAISPDGRSLVYLSSSQPLGGSHSLWLKQLATNQETPLLPETELIFRGLAFSPDGQFIYYAQRPAHSASNTLYRLSIHGGLPQKLLVGVDSAVSFSPDGKQIAFVREDETVGESALLISNADGTAERKLAACRLPDNFSVDGPSWSADGRQIAIAKMLPAPDFHFRLLSLRVIGAAQPIGETQWAWLMRVAWQQDGKGLFVVGRTKTSAANYQIWQVTYPAGEVQKVTNDLHSYRNLNLTPDSTQLVTVQSEVRANLWLVPADNPARGVPLTNDSINQNGYSGLDWTPRGEIVYTSIANGRENLWRTNTTGAPPRQLTPDANDTHLSPSLSPDGSYVVFTSSRSGPSHIWRLNIDDSKLTEITQGTQDLNPQCSPDGKWILYSAERNGRRVIMKRPVQGGPNEEIVVTDKWSDFPAVSPDNQWLACLYQEQTNSPRKIALLPFAGGAPTRLLELPNTYPSSSLRWHPQNRALSYLDPKDNFANVWLFPLHGGAPSQMTSFQSERIFAYAWSRDGRFLACARGTTNSNVVLLENFGK